MFLSSLDDSQKGAFLALAACIAPPEETGLLQWPLWQEWLSEMGYPPLTRVGSDDAVLAAGAFATGNDNLIALVELARLSWEAIDVAGLLRRLEHVGGLVGCTSEEVAAVIDWAERLAALRAEASALASTTTDLA
ncbi:MAG: hypothetical protein HY985_15865 [Magnetospirillum sp.]|nr:hypothetical protein [Magnetospirillum sp.]